MKSSGKTSDIDPGDCQAPAGVRRRLLGAVAAAGAVAATGAALPLRARAQSKQVNVGVVLPLSGANAQFGINSRNGIELVADEINAAGGI